MEEENMSEGAGRDTSPAEGSETVAAPAAAARASKAGMGRQALMIAGAVVIVAGTLLATRNLPVPGTSDVAAVGTAGATADAGKLSDSQVQEVISRVGKLILLPAGETPIIATVTDAATLRASQPFYQSAENGDYLLIYQSQARAILYDPNKNLLVNVGAIQVPPQPAPEASSTANAPAGSESPAKAKAGTR